MTNEVVQYCARAIVQYLNSDFELFQQYANKAINLDCSCTNLVKCKYMGQTGYLCTNCGRVWINGKVKRRCNVRKVGREKINNRGDDDVYSL